MAKNWNSKKIIVIGAARQGLALSRYLAAHNALVYLTDSHNDPVFPEEQDDLKSAGITMKFGGHPLEILEDASLICLSGGVPLTIPFIQEARNRGIPLSNDSQIFMEECKGTVIGITGSAGKTTTTSLVGSMAEKFFYMKNSDNRAWVGGNIGNPLIEKVDEIKSDDLVILELSSFQLELMRTSPQIAAVLNITPNHLDRHPSMQAYISAKTNILNFQHQSDIAILNRDDPGSWELSDQVKSELISFGLKKPSFPSNGTYVEKENIWLQIGKDNLKLFPLEWIQLRGKHNLYNVLAACAIAAGSSIALPAIQTAVEEFEGVSHRLEFVRSVKGADWYNDSIATAPERTIAAVESFNQPLILLLGGRDKNLPWEKLVDLIRQRVRHVVLFGEASELIISAIGQLKNGTTLQTVTKCATLEEAVREAFNLTQPGDVVLFSPGGTSFDAFKDFEERGNCFRQLVRALE